MIKITNVTKVYDNRPVLKNIDLSLPKRGLVVIYGSSGSGKTTLLNCIAGITSFEGSIEVNHQHIESMDDASLSKMRLSTYGFIFQDFKLFETETVLANLLFPLETLYSLSKAKKMRKCRDLLSLVGLEGYEKQIVNKLSGGEKQRVAIARALINDPVVLLADEPTGALDEQNGIEVMNLIKKISRKSLVIVVSHDRELTQKYADQIIEVDNGEIASIETQESLEIEEEHLPIIHNGIVNKKPRISEDFLINHTFHTMKQKKMRTGLCYMMTSLGLIGVGLAFALSSSIAGNIKQAYREIVDENSLMVTLKDKNSSVMGQYAASYYEVNEIKEKYPEYISDIGVTYYCNFEKFFIDINNLAIVRENKYSIIPGFSARHINEFEWLEDVKTTIYPKATNKLQDDEIILALNYVTLRDLCFELQIERTVSSLTDYLLSHDLYVFFDLENDAWQYSDQQILRLKGFALENDLKIYHSNHLWNEYMFEERMRFPVNDVLSVRDEEPWVMKKLYYLKANNQRDELLNLLIDDKETDRFIFEIANENYYPWLYYQKKNEDRDRLLVFTNTVAHIPHWHVNYFVENDDNLKKPVYGNSGGYFIYPESLMVGFARTLYFSKDQEAINEIVDKQTTHNKDGFFEEELPKGMASGNYATGMQNGVKFDIFSPDLSFVGDEPITLDEIAISTNLMKECQIESVGETLYVTTVKKEMVTNTGQVISDYEIVPLRVSAIVQSNRNLIYHYSNWTTLFYQCKIGLSAFDLQTTSMSFSLNNPNKISNSLSLFKKAFPQYEAVNPLSDINESVDTVCFYITIVLIIFSSVATLISILLLTICNYLYIIEGKKEIALARCLGVNKKESRRFLYYHSIIQCMLSFIIASFELIIFSIIANLEIGQALSMKFSFSFDPICLVPMFFLALIIALVSSFVMSSRINKINPLDALIQ